MDCQTKTPIQTAIPVDLERRISELEYSSHTGPPNDLDDNRKRWLVVGICLHSILSPALRKYVNPVVTKLYNSLKLTDNIDIQTHTGHLQNYGATNIYLNYEAINNNKAMHGYRKNLFDYNVQNVVDLSKLFLQTHMAHYTAFDVSCDSSALLGMVDRIDSFPGNVQMAASNVRSAIRNSWAHCNFTEWDSMKYNVSLQQIEDFIYLLKLNVAEENQFIGEINKWRTNGTSFLQGTTLGLELVNDIRQQIQVLIEYAKVICKSADTELLRVQTELRDIGKLLRLTDNRISVLENTVAIQGQALFECGAVNDADIPEIELWKQKGKLFVETDVVTDLLGILESHHCLLLTGVSGMGKTLTAHYIALKFYDEKKYRIEPCIDVKDIKRRYKQNIRQLFFVDDICGKYAANINDIENWLRTVEFIRFILDKGKTKILATCRTEVFSEKIFEETFNFFSKDVNVSKISYSLQDKMKIARNYLKKDDKTLLDIIKTIEFSPLMCFLYSQHEQFDINDFLNSPFDTFCFEWDKLKTFDKEKLCVLLLCVIHNGTIDETMFDVPNDFNKDEKKKFKDILECCKLGRDTSRSGFKDKLDACVGTYFIKKDKVYNVIHDKMFDFLCCYFGKTLISPILKYADDNIICERVQLESIRKTHGEFTIRISSNDEQKYKDRLRLDLVNGKIHWCLNNVQMRHKEYRNAFLEVLKDFDDDLKKRFIGIKDENGINSFIISCLRGYDDVVLFFISVGADVDAQNGWFTPLTAACRDGHSETVGILLENGSMVNKTNKFGETPLYTACICGHYGIVKCLIEKRCDINVRDKCNHTPLCVSCLGGFKNIAILLIDQGTNAVECCNYLLISTHGGHVDIVDMLIKKGWDVNSVDKQGRTALFIACEEGYTKIVTLLIDTNADIYKFNNSGDTPLHAACLAGNFEIVRILIEHNGYIDMLDQDGETPLHKACRQGSTSVIQTLIGHGANINLVNIHGFTTLDLQKQNHDIRENEQKGCLKVANTWCQNNRFRAQKNDTTDYLVRYGMTPLYEACMDGDIKLVQSLIAKGANVNMKTNCGEPPLVAACQQGHCLLIQLLIDKGSDISDALLVAVQNDYDITVNILWYKGGNLSFQTVDGSSLLELAYEHGSIKVITFLLQKGVDITEIRNYYHLPLCMACTKGYDETVRILIKQGENVNHRCTKDGKTPLWSACKRGFNKIVEILIANGADVYEIEETAGKTLLHVTSTIYLFRLLIGISSDLNKPDNYGRYPLYESMVNGVDDISDYLLQKDCPIAISEEDKKTALISVFESGNTELSRLVVSRGYTNGIANFNETILHNAYRLGLFEDVKILLKNGGDVNEVYHYDYTPEILADIAGNNDLSKYLIQKGCSIGGNDDLSEYQITQDYNYGLRYCVRRSKNNETVYITRTGVHKQIITDKNCDEYEYLFQACMTGYTNPWRMCVDEKPFPERKINFFFRSKERNGFIWFKQTPLCLASRMGHIEVVKLLLKYGAKVDKMSEDENKDYGFPRTYRKGYTSLFAACQRKYYDIVDILLEGGANLNNALFIACQEGYLDTVQFLVQKGADVNSICPNGQTALFAACNCGYYAIVKYLIHQGALIDTIIKINAISIKKQTCLNFVYTCGKLQMLKLLIEKGSSINTMCKIRKKLLQSACKGGIYTIIEMLINSGININDSDKYGVTPLLACVSRYFAGHLFGGDIIHQKRVGRSQIIHIGLKPFVDQEVNINAMMNDNSDIKLTFDDSDDELTFDDSDDELTFDDIDVKWNTSPQMKIKWENLIVNHREVIQQMGLISILQIVKEDRHCLLLGRIEIEE